MKFDRSERRITGRYLSGSVALLALVLSSCTATGTGGQNFQMATDPNNGSVLTESLQSAADQQIAAEAGADKSATEQQANLAEKKPETPADAVKQAALKADTAASTTTQTEDAPATQVAGATPQKKTGSLMSLFGSKQPEQHKPADTSAQAAAPNTPEAEPLQSAKAETKPSEPEQAPAQETAQATQPEKPVQVTSLFGGTPKNANAFATPQRPATTASQGSIARLFADDAGNARSDRTENKKLAVAKPVSAAKHAYNYTLPGVRANGGFEIKHRNSMGDDSDIDANEDDEFPAVTLASAPGLARLAPNGLKVQRETVDVACLKPQLVSMLRTMERHFRRPVMVTSGYRSPSYNRKVNGARKSMHMICAAADIQIEGVSKWEIARFARSMSGRGGVGTYCHTKSVHVDIGPERDWNWRCRR